MNKTEIGCAGLLFVLAIFIATSYGLYLRPDGKQKKETLALVITAAVLTGIITGIFAYVGLKGNVTAQLQFFIPIMILALLPTCIISATISANQLYGLREAVAAGKCT
jgi:hypothetical protein